MKLSTLRAAVITGAVSAMTVVGIVDAQQMTSPGASLANPSSAPSIFGSGHSSATTSNTANANNANTSTPIAPAAASSASIYTNDTNAPATSTEGQTHAPSSLPAAAAQASTTAAASSSSVVSPAVANALSTAGVQAASSSLLGTWPPANEPRPAIVDITSQGGVLIRGTLVAHQSGTLTIRSWGGDWVINTAGALSVMPSLSSMNIGDYVGVIGLVAPDAQLSIDASVVRDWSTNP